MRKKTLFAVAVLILVSFTSVLSFGADGDGCFVPSKPVKVHEPKQEAIIAWNGEMEKMILTVDIFGEEDTSGFHVIPFPSELLSIELCDAEVFGDLEPQTYEFRLYDYYWDEITIVPGGEGDSNSYGDERGKQSSVEIIEQRSIGDHDVTSIRVNDVDDFRTEFMQIVKETGIGMNEWPDGMLDVINSYTSRNITHFVGTPDFVSDKNFYLSLCL